ncbi:MAG: DUF4340 domain-containing protein [Bacteroidales bacterium]|nr:DUF4340 domain-containing protein [Bacteroidales bacterium]
MKRKTKNRIILIVSFLLIVGVVAILLLKDNSTIEQNYHIEDTKTITKVIIDDKDGNHLELIKETDSIWKANNSPANMKVVDMLLSTLKDMRIREPIAQAARNNIVKQLAASGKTVKIYQDAYSINLGFIKLFKKEKLTKTIYVGSETQDNMGTYMMLKGEESPCIIYIPRLKGYLSTRFSALEDFWKSHAVFKYNRDEIASLKIEIPNQKSESFMLTKNGEGFDFTLLESGQKLQAFDTLKVKALLSSCFEVNYESVATNISKLEQDTIFGKAPAFVLTIKDNKGKENILKTYSKLHDPTSIAEGEDDFYRIFDVNRCYALHSENKDTLIMQFFTLDNLLKPASYYFLTE